MWKNIHLKNYLNNILIIRFYIIMYRLYNKTNIFSSYIYIIIIKNIWGKLLSVQEIIY